jgi:endo-1,4-beta-D-glucanase Y
MNHKTSGTLAGLAFVAAVISGCGGGGGTPLPTLAASSTLVPAQQASTAAASSTPRQTAMTAGAPFYPFGSRQDAYKTTMRVSGTSAQRDQQIHNWYAAWAPRLVSTPKGLVDPGGVGGCFAVSEGTGYAMLITVVMAGDPLGDLDAKSKFDGLLTAAMNNPATGSTMPFNEYGTGAPLNANNYLMSWCLNSSGENGSSDPSPYNAVDGDLDIALALLMADRQWGSTGAINYKQRALRTIGAIKAFNMDANGNVLSRGPRDDLKGMMRSSDLMIGHFRAFAQATGDPLWTTAVERAFTVIGAVQGYTQRANPPGTLTGLMPDWVDNTNTAQPKPWTTLPPPEVAAYPAGVYAVNAQRDPFRFAADYVYSGDARWVGSTGRLDRIAQFFSSAWQNSPGPDDKSSYKTGVYNLDGTLFSNAGTPQYSGGSYLTQAMAGAVMASAMAGTQYQALLDNTWHWLVDLWPTNGYYEGELALLSMFVVSGNWWLPTANPCTVDCGPTDPPPTGLKVEAESGTLHGSGVSVRSDIPNASGGSFVGDFHTAGDSLTLSFAGVTAGTYDVKIHYHAWTAQQNNVTINGTARSVAFPASTPTTSDWVDAIIPGVSLPAGTTTVVISKDWGYIDVDYVQLVSGGGGTPPPTKVQAESGTVQGTGVSARSDFAGYEGSGFVGDFHNAGDSLTVNFTGLAAGTYTLTIRYHAWTAQQNNVSINGSVRSVQFPASTPTTSDWVTVQVPNVTLTSGTNTVVISKDWGYIDVDWLQVSQ